MGLGHEYLGQLIWGNYRENGRARSAADKILCGFIFQGKLRGNVFDFRSSCIQALLSCGVPQNQGP